MVNNNSLRSEKSQYLFSAFFAFFVFMSINLPSIKLMYSSIVLNFIALIGMLGFGSLRWVLSNRELDFNYKMLKFSVNFMIFWTTLFLITTIMSPSFITISDLMQYLSIIPFTLGIMLFINKIDFPLIACFQIIWGTIIAFLEWSVGIPKDRALGQNYLTSGVVIAATIVVLVGVILSKNTNVIVKILLSFPLLILFLGILSLSGRAPLLLSMLVPMLVLLINIMTEKNLRKKIVTLVIMVTSVIVLYLILRNTLNQYTINRILRMFNSIQDEPRYDVYASSIEVAINNPLGLGLTGFRYYDFGYPHNIFLEIVISGGFIAVIPFVIMILDYIHTGFKIAKNKGNSIIWLNLSLYFFITWNISFNLSSSYMLFISLAIFIKSSSYNLNSDRENVWKISQRNLFSKFSPKLISNSDVLDGTSERSG